MSKTDFYMSLQTKLQREVILKGPEFTMKSTETSFMIEHLSQYHSANQCNVA